MTRVQTLDSLDKQRKPLHTANGAGKSNHATGQQGCRGILL